MSVFARFAERALRTDAQYPMSPAMRAANADGQLFSSPEVFAARAFNDFPHDKHIAPQGGWGAELADLIAPLECSQSTWVLIRRNVPGLPDAVPHENRGSRLTHLAPAAVARFYASDIALWEKVSREFEPENLSARRPNLDGAARRQAKVVRENRA